MSTTKKGQNACHFEHTPTVSARRRSLFPADIIESEEDSDIGHISPLSFDSDHEDLKYLAPAPGSDDGYLSSKTNSIGDYDILGVVENMQDSVCTPITKKNYSLETMSPLYLSPYCTRLKPTSNTIINETPLKMPPSYNLKTPHDASNTNSKVPKLVRKSLLDILENSSTKRKLTPVNSPEQKTKHFKLDPKNSKVRTTLFPEVDISLPTKSFYPKSKNIMENLPKRNKFSNSSLLPNIIHKVKNRKKIGEINAGVGHKIRKPKRKKINKSSFVKAAINVVNNTAINEYIKDLTELNATKTDKIKLIENKENASPNLIVEDQFIPHQLIENNIIPSKTNDSEINSNKKRERSPTSELDPNKKFFKFSRSRAVVKMHKNIKLQVDNGKVTLLEKERKNKKRVPKIILDSSDLIIDEPFMLETNIDNILSSLDNGTDKGNIEQNGTKIVLQAHNSVSASENSILLHPQPTNSNANLILSPISQMCDVTSGLALNSPKKVKDLTAILSEMPNASTNIFTKENSADTEKQKLFPIFCARNISVPEKKNKVTTRATKKFKTLEMSQMLLDAGQKKFGVIQCSECSFVYHIGDPSDENMHLNYHNASHILKFAGWKNERVVADFSSDGRIIQILPEDSKIWWKKIKELMDLINRELGCFEMKFGIDHCQVYLYIKAKTIAGCVVAVPKSEGHRMLTTKQSEADLCSEETYPIKCGISRIWVSQNHRKQGIATALMNTVKKNFMFGYILDNCDIALSSPTDMGKSFAISYFESPNYLIYYM